jgi:hypothetical protein
MAKICHRQGQRYTSKTSDAVLIEDRSSSQVFEGQLIDQSEGGICVAFAGERPALAPNQKIHVRCRAGNGKGEVSYFAEDTPSSFRIGVKWAP